MLTKSRDKLLDEYREALGKAEKHGITDGISAIALAMPFLIGLLADIRDAVIESEFKT